MVIQPISSRSTASGMPISSNSTTIQGRQLGAPIFLALRSYYRRVAYKCTGRSLYGKFGCLYMGLCLAKLVIVWLTTGKHPRQGAPKSSGNVSLVPRAVKCSQLKHQLARALKPARAAAYLS